MASNTWKPWKPCVGCIWYHSTNSAPAITMSLSSTIKVPPTSCGCHHHSLWKVVVPRGLIANTALMMSYSLDNNDELYIIHYSQNYTLSSSLLHHNVSH
jgi:hypothetical protein